MMYMLAPCWQGKRVSKPRGDCVHLVVAVGLRRGCSLAVAVLRRLRGVIVSMCRTAGALVTSSLDIWTG